MERNATRVVLRCAVMGLGSPDKGTSAQFYPRLWTLPFCTQRVSSSHCDRRNLSIAPRTVRTLSQTINHPIEFNLMKNISRIQMMHDRRAVVFPPQLS